MQLVVFTNHPGVLCIVMDVEVNCDSREEKEIERLLNGEFLHFGQRRLNAIPLRLLDKTSPLDVILTATVNDFLRHRFLHVTTMTCDVIPGVEVNGVMMEFTGVHHNMHS